MKHIIRATAILIASITVASASCPPNLPYGCQQTASGKMRCGCGY